MIAMVMKLARVPPPVLVGSPLPWRSGRGAARWWKEDGLGGHFWMGGMGQIEPGREWGCYPTLPPGPGSWRRCKYPHRAGWGVKVRRKIVPCPEEICSHLLNCTALVAPGQVKVGL